MHRTKKVAALFVAAWMAFSAFGQERGTPIFSDNFDTNMTFAENWSPGKGWNGRIKSENGRVVFPQAGVLLMRRDTPQEFYVEADFTIQPDGFGKPISERKSTFCGFICENYAFYVLPWGNTWMIWKLPGQKNAQGKQTKIEGFEIGKPVRLTLIRQVDKGTARYLFKVNGKDAGDFFAPFDEKNAKPLQIFSANLKIEVDQFSLCSVRRDRNASPNMIVNSSFEYDEDGIPTYYCRFGTYNFLKFGKVSYEQYLNSWKVDPSEKHSGKQSLKLVIDDASKDYIQIWAHGAGTVQGKPGVFSVWMKSDRDSLPVTIAYGKGKNVTVGREWKRYEVMSPSLPGVGTYPPVTITVSAKNQGTLWIDDLQAELIESAKNTSAADDGTTLIKTYATPYKPSEVDKIKFAADSKPVRTPRISVPLLPRGVVPGVRLDEWKNKAAEVKNFYFKDQKPSRGTAAYLACDERNLYIGFRNSGEDTTALSVPPRKYDDMASLRDNSLELFFITTDIKKWYHLTATEKGEQVDLYKEDIQWNGHWKTAAAVNAAAGSIDYLITIPFSDFASPDLKSRWFVNLCRNDVREKSKAEYQCIAKTNGIGYRQHDYWPEMDLPESVIRKWSSGALSASYTPNADGNTSYRFVMRNNSEEKKAVIAELFNQSGTSAPFMGKQDFVLLPGESNLSFSFPVFASKVCLKLKSGGEVISNQVFIPKKETPLSVLGRLNFYMNEPEAVFKVSSRLPDHHSLRAVLECAGRKVTTPAAASFRMILPLKGIPNGTHPVSVKLLKQDGSVAAFANSELIKKTYWEGATQINRFSRSLYRKGKSLFMVGPFFGDFGFTNLYTNNISLKMLEMAEKYGFKNGHILIGSRAQSVDNGTAFLKAAASRDFNLILWAKYSDPKAAYDDEEMIKRLASTNILSNMVCDEPELNTPSELCRKYMQKMRRKFPYQPTHMNNTVLGIPNRYANLETDILMLDSYLTSVEKQKVERIVHHADLMYEAGREEGKPCYYFLVCTNFPLHYKEPTYGEQIAQSYGSIAAGCTGISYYIGFPTAPGSWNAMVQVNKEVLSIEDALLSEEDVAASSSDRSSDIIRHLTKKHNGSLYLITVNIDKNPAGKVSFNLPSGYRYDGPVEVLFENRKLNLKDGKFSDDFAGHNRHVYKVKIK